jgi:hypothetical protein
MPKKGSIEHEMLKLIMSSGETGIIQSELWKKIAADSREGSRAILRLERKKLIERKRELHEGRWTYRVFPKRKLSTVESIIDCPCAFCEDEGRCGQTAEIFPGKCLKLTEWLTAMAGKP